MAPLIATLLSSGLNLIANAALVKGKEWVEEKTGVQLPEDGKLSDESKERLRIAMMEHEEELLRLRLDSDKLSVYVDELYLKDVQNARGMQIAALLQDDIFSKRFIYYFAIAWSGFCAIYLLAITFATIPEKNIRFVDTTLGFLLGTVIATLIAFFYGSSKQTREKDSMNAQLTEALRHVSTK